MTDEEKAILLINSISKALKRGVKHLDKDGNELTTVRAVLEALDKGETITVEKYHDH